ncbi:hypothetical protein MXB_5673, partial [Myxobolus squamalis]
YDGEGKKPLPKTSDFLQKRLQKGVKYFDSGDYIMNKSKFSSDQKTIGASVLASPSINPPAYNNPESIKKRSDLPISKLAAVEDVVEDSNEFENL